MKVLLTRLSRGAWITLTVFTLVVAIALAPGSFGHALAQTGDDDGGSSSSSTSGETTVSNNADGSLTTTTSNSDGSTTAVTVSTDGTTKTETLEPNGTKTTETAKPDGEKETVVQTTVGTVTTVEKPGEPARTTVQLANPNAPSTVGVTTLSLTLSVSPGVLGSPTDVLAFVEAFIEELVESIGVDPSNIVVELDLFSSVTRIPAASALPGRTAEDFAAAVASVRAVKMFEINLTQADGTPRQPGKPVQITWQRTCPVHSPRWLDPLCA